MINDIKYIISTYNYTYIKNQISSISRINNLLINEIIFSQSNDTEMIYLGLYYREI